MRDHMKMMWGCAAIMVLIVVLGAAGVTGAWAALFALPCVVMMAAMVWMMVRMTHGVRK